MITHKNENIYISGLPDRFSKFFKIKREVEKIEDYLKKSPSIFISHQPKDYKILLIDDSITTRTLEKNILPTKKNNFNRFRRT